MTDQEPVASPQAPEISDLPVGRAPTEPVERERPPARGITARTRWAVALVIVALLVAATAAGAALLTGARTASTVARWAPSDALVYGELRPDLPGDQRDALAAFLSAFPGFSDRSILERKLSEVYDRLLSDATKGEQTYSADIAPWFGGQLGAAIGAPAGLSSTVLGNAPPRVLLIATTTDASKAIAWFRAAVTKVGASVTMADAGGTQLLLATASAGSGETIAAAAPTGVLLVGDEASVRAAITRAGTGGLAADASFQAALAALPDDGLATTYVHVAAYAELLTQMSKASGLASPLPDMASLLPAWSAASLRATSDALAFDAAAPKTAATGVVADGPSALPGRLPATTIGLVDVHDAGHALLGSLEALGGAQRTDLDNALKPIGGLDALVGWLGETAVAVVPTAAGPVPGIVALATDTKAAQGLSGSLANLATISGLHPVERTYAGHTMTTVDLSPSGETGATLDPAVGSSHLAVSWTIADDLVVVATDPAFVEAVLDTKSGASLAQASRFTSMVGRVSSSSHALAWADLVATRELLVSRLTADERTRYEADVAPYLAPFAGVVGVATHDGSLMRAHGLLVLERP